MNGGRRSGDRWAGSGRFVALVCAAWLLSNTTAERARAAVTVGCPGGPCSAMDADDDGLLDADDPCPQEPRNLCFGPVAVDAVRGRPIRLNAGPKLRVHCAGERTICNGEVWGTDFGFNQFRRTSTCDLNGGGEGCEIAGIEEIFGCTDDATEDLFQCEHFDRIGEPEIAWRFNVANGEYLVNLYFANTFSNTVAVGSRVFDIAVEGQVAYDDFDQVLAAGASAVAVVRSVVADVTDGLLTIDFRHGVENPAVKAIEVLGFVQCSSAGDCDDANVCNGTEMCVDFHCVGGEALVCSDGALCNGAETCDPVTGCESGAPVDCTPLDTFCAVGACSEEVEGCTVQPRNEGSECAEPLDACTLAHRCIEGECTALPLCDLRCERCDEGECTSLCGNPFDPDTTGRTIVDGLFILRAAVGTETCAPCVCDLTGDLAITASDALALARLVTGLPVELNCPLPGSTTTTSTSTTTSLPTTTLPVTTTTAPATTTTTPPTSTTVSVTTTTLPATTTTVEATTTTVPSTTTTFPVTTTTEPSTTSTTSSATTTTST